MTMHHRVLPNPTAEGALLCAMAACGGESALQEEIYPHLQPILDVLGEMGCNIRMGGNAALRQPRVHLDYTD